MAVQDSAEIVSVRNFVATMDAALHTGDRRHLRAAAAKVVGGVQAKDLLWYVQKHLRAEREARRPGPHRWLAEAILNHPGVARRIGAYLRERAAGESGLPDKGDFMLAVSRATRLGHTGPAYACFQALDAPARHHLMDQAAVSGQSRLFWGLVRRGGHPGVYAGAGRRQVDRPLQFAAIHNHARLVRELLADRRVDAEVDAARASDPLVLAAGNGASGALQALLEDPRFQQRERVNAAYLEAARQGHHDCLERLLAARPLDPLAQRLPEVPGAEACDATEMAILSGCAETFETLFKNPALRGARDRYQTWMNRALSRMWASTMTEAILDVAHEHGVPLESPRGQPLTRTVSAARVRAAPLIWDRARYYAPREGEGEPRRFARLDSATLRVLGSINGRSVWIEPETGGRAVKARAGDYVDEAGQVFAPHRLREHFAHLSPVRRAPNTTPDGGEVKAL